MLLVAAVHGGLVAAVTVSVRVVAMGVAAAAGTVDLWRPELLYLAPVQTQAQSTAILFAAVAPVVLQCTLRRVEPASVSAQMQHCYFVVLVLTAALFLDTLVAALDTGPMLVAALVLDVLVFFTVFIIAAAA